ncbi:hypothetical protein BJV78DRAFT_717291 [Lactifluus subvellereus]|nr:hypothetical protein BJV78DRAFT_717291 [Lactifluus subvellereus]
MSAVTVFAHWSYNISILQRSLKSPFCHGPYQWATRLLYYQVESALQSVSVSSRTPSFLCARCRRQGVPNCRPAPYWKVYALLATNKTWRASMRSSSMSPLSLKKHRLCVHFDITARTITCLLKVVCMESYQRYSSRFPPRLHCSTLPPPGAVAPFDPKVETTSSMCNEAEYKLFE